MKRIKYLGVNLPKEIRSIHRNYKTLVKKIKEDTNTWRNIPCSCIRRINIEATVRTGHGTTDWFQIGKGVRQGCILSPCLFNYMQSTS